jgi:hypothetical protein
LIFIGAEAPVRLLEADNRFSDFPSGALIRLKQCTAVLQRENRDHAILCDAWKLDGCFFAADNLEFAASNFDVFHDLLSMCVVDKQILQWNTKRIQFAFIYRHNSENLFGSFHHFQHSVAVLPARGGVLHVVDVDQRLANVR